MQALTPNRKICPKCLRPIAECYCEKIKRFTTRARFVILFHPDERRRGIATGRMTSLCLENSELIEGYDFSQDEKVGRLLTNPAYHCVILYPSATATFIDRLEVKERAELFPADKIPLIFIIDGTWHNARKMVKRSQNLQQLPCICFQPMTPSRFMVRKQPNEHCYATIEAVHRLLEILDTSGDAGKHEYDNLLEVFDYMVQRQVVFHRRAHE